MNDCLLRAWGIGILLAVGLSGCGTLAPRGDTRAEIPAKSAFVSPLPGSSIISPFGVRGRRMHEGVDLKKSAGGGDAVVAARDGIVETARRSRSYGLTVVIGHSDGSHTRYAHLRKILVNKHQWVGAGQKVGLVGSTGRATTPHLHYEIRTCHGEFIDPVPYLHAAAPATTPATAEAKKPSR